MSSVAGSPHSTHHENTNVLTRLPTNPRRRKVPAEKRKRAARACNACNLKRVKCTGEQPCPRCIASSQTCQYPAAKETAPPTKDLVEELQQRCLFLEKCLADAVPDKAQRAMLLSKWKVASSDPESLAAKSASLQSRSVSMPLDNSEEVEPTNGRVLQGPDGFVRYLGESSGATLIDRLREFVGTVTPLISGPGVSVSPDTSFTYLLGQYHTHDTKPLLLPNVDPMYLPEPEEISRLLSTFRNYAGDENGRGEHGGIYYWGNLDNLQSQVMDPTKLADLKLDTHQLCCLNAIMALACQYEPQHAWPWETNPGETFFARARLLLIDPMEDASVLYMRALCLMGNYLLGLYRRDAAFMYIGLAMRISVVHGLHKNTVGEEINKEFWNTFIFDRWLSCLMGRPAAVPLDGITVDLPVDYSYQRSTFRVEGQTSHHLSSAAGIRAHAQLSLIMDEIINSVYGISSRGLSFPRSLSLGDNALQRLSLWYAELPACCQFQTVIEPYASRANIILHMMYNQLIILCTRPLLFQAAKQSVAAKYLPTNQHLQKKPNISHITSCTKAARDIKTLTENLVINNQAAVLSNVDYHLPFTAAIVLVLASLIPEHNIQNDHEAIAYLVEYLQKAGESGNESAADCVQIVREFNDIASRLRLQKSSRYKITSVTPARTHFSNETLPNNVTENAFGQVEQVQENVNTDFQFENGSFFDGRTETYDQLYAWFIESPI